MDNQTLIRLSKFTIEARKVVGPVNPAKMLKDPLYSAEIFKRIDDSANEGLISLALDLYHELGLLETEKPTVVEAKPDKPVIREKYMLGARG